MSTVPTAPQLPLFGLKICSKCGVPKPPSEYYVKIKATGRLCADCKECHKDKTTAHQIANRPVYAAYARDRRARDPEAALEKERASRERNRDKINAQSKERAKRPEERAKKAAYRLAKRAERLAYNKRYREEHKAERAAYNAAYYRENKDEVRARTRACMDAKPDQYRAMHSRWKSQNKDAVNASTHKRRARIKAGGSWTKDDWQRLKATYDWRCLGCGRQEMTDEITLCFDHIIPLSMGGFNIIQNCQCLCRSCNSLKHRKVLDLRDRSYPFKKED